ncbi:unnamed protein product [Tilletia laevis]|uniref:Uncharacterized protein n=2 Tax=Tilletia TaxID=13289 RepID=A0A177V976_9BASI|nr:hypothetical protein CF336_g4991 [Tilletia laevis]KAE8258791.1 hypothetical protein A4X03_0g4284 [Tilletia caries]KAE8198634.1 hypothetical protein CF335_g4343 [Tilletia laevis]CAD6888078.1 unnamed protein product [Tilletia caries]CAD6900562.1 unnamed protein product [Tilletia laevis]
MSSNGRRPSAASSHAAAHVPSTVAGSPFASLSASAPDPEEQKRVTMLLDDLERELLHQRTSGHRVNTSISTISSVSTATAGGSNNRFSRPMGPPPTEPLPQLPTFPSTSSGSTNDSRPSSLLNRINSIASGTKSVGASTPATSIRAGNTANNSQESWLNCLAGPRASSTFSRNSFDSSNHHVTARYTICAADDEEDEAHMSDDSRVLSLSNYHSFHDHDGIDDERRTPSLPHHSTLLTTRITDSSKPYSPSSSISPRSSMLTTESRISTESGAPSTTVPTVMIDEVDDFSDDTADYLDDSEDDARRKRRKKPTNRWGFEDQRAMAPSLPRATAARLAGPGGPSANNHKGALTLGLHLNQPAAGPSSFASSSPLAAPSDPSTQSFTPGSIVPPSASEFTFYEFAPDLPPFAPKDLKPKDLTGTGTWRSIVARATASATAPQRGSMLGSTDSSGFQQDPQQQSSSMGPVSVRQLAADTRARQQRELVMRQRQAQLFAQTKLEPIDLHRHAQQVASMSERGMSPSPAPSFTTNGTGGMGDEGEEEPDSLHRGLFRSASVSLSGYWDPLENISAYGGSSVVGGGGNGDGASIRSSTYTNPGLGLDFQRQMVQQKVYADSGTQTSPTSSPSTSRPASPDELPETGGAAGESMPSSMRTPRKVLAGAGTQTDASGGRTTPSNERTPNRAGMRSAVSGSTRPQLINRRRSTIGKDGRADRADRLAEEEEGNEPDGWRTPVRVPKLSSKKSNIGTIGRVSSPTTTLRPRRTSTNTLMMGSKPLSPLGFGQGMNKDELAIFNGLSQHEGSDAGISSDDDDSDAGSCESDLDLNTPLEELAERSGALSTDARGAKRKFEVQRRTNGLVTSTASASSNLSRTSPKGFSSGPGLSPASARIDREDTSSPTVTSRVVAPLPRGLRHAGNAARPGPRGQIGGRALGTGLRVGAARTTAVAYSSDEEDATATETENVRSGLTRKGGARTALYPRTPATFTQSKMSRPSLNSLRKGSVPEASCLARAETAPTTPSSRTRPNTIGTTPTSVPSARTSIGSDAGGRGPTVPSSRRNSPLKAAMSIPELDELLNQHKEATSTGKEDTDTEREGLTGVAPLNPARERSKSSFQEDDDLLTSDLDFAMPPSGDSFQSIDDLDGLLDSPHQPNGYGVRSVTGTASLRKPASVPAFVTERLAGLALIETTPRKAAPLPALPQQSADDTSGKGLLDIWYAESSIGHGPAPDEDAYASSTLHGHTRAAMMRKTAKGAVASASVDADLDESSTQDTPLATIIDLPPEREEMGSDASTPEAVNKPISELPATPGSRSSVNATAVAAPRRSIPVSGVTRPSSVSEQNAQGESTAEATAGIAARQRSASQASRIRAPASGRTSLPMSSRSGLRQPGSSSMATPKAVERKTAAAAAAAAASAGTPTATSMGNEKPIRKMKSFGDRSSTSFVSPSISTMPRSRPGQTPSPDLNKNLSSGSSRPGSAAATRRSIPTNGGLNRPPSSTSMRRAAIPARKNSDALPSDLPQPPGSGNRESLSSAAASPIVGSSRALSPTTPRKTGLRSPALQKPQLRRTGSGPVPAQTAGGSRATSPAPFGSVVETSPQSQHTPTLSSSSRTSSTSSTDSPPMPLTPALGGPAPSPSPSRAVSRMPSMSGLRKPSAIARPSGLPAPSSRSSALPVPR